MRCAALAGVMRGVAPADARGDRALAHLQKQPRAHRQTANCAPRWAELIVENTAPPRELLLHPSSAQE